VLTQGRDAGLVTKSNLILGMGEEIAEVTQALRDLHDCRVRPVTITQYLRPTRATTRWSAGSTPGGVRRAGRRGRGDRASLGVMSGPLVRSSYRAGRLYLPKAISPAEMTEVRNRLRAMPSGANQLPIPKGPLPKNVKLPKGGIPPR
jgi:lipoyl synthase